MSEEQPIDEDFLRQHAFAIALRAAPVPLITYGLIAINVLVYLAMIATAPTFLAPTNREMLKWGADFGPLTLNGQWWRLISSCFLHFGFIHIAMNMYILYRAGIFTEKLYGNVRFLVLYLLAGVGGSLVSLYSHPVSVSAGASGAVFGVYGGLLAFLLMQRGFVPPTIAWALAKSSGIFIVINAVYGAVSPGTDIQAHGGGLLCGFLLGCALAAPMPATGQRLLPVRTIAVIVCSVGIFYAGFAHLHAPAKDVSGLYQTVVTGQRLAVGNGDTILYNGSATKEDAQSFGRALVKVGYFSKPSQWIMLSKGTDRTVISIPTGAKDRGVPSSANGSAGETARLAPDPWDDPHFLAWTRLTGTLLAPSVGGPAIKIVILSAQGTVMKTVPIDMRQIFVGEKDSIFYGGTATLEDANALGRALESAGVFQDRGMRVLLSKGGSEGTTLSFAAKEGAWEDAKTVSTFAQMGARVADSVGGLPMTIYLLNQDLERKKNMVIVKQIKSAAGYKLLPSGD